MFDLQSTAYDVRIHTSFLTNTNSDIPTSPVDVLISTLLQMTEVKLKIKDYFLF